jgi:hypothetical protein
MKTPSVPSASARTVVQAIVLAATTSPLGGHVDSINDARLGVSQKVRALGGGTTPI